MHLIEGDVIIQENDFGNIISLDSLYPLTAVDGYFQITSNLSLTSLKGLDNLTEVEVGLDILSSPGLTDLNGLNALTTVGNMVIAANHALSSLQGLESLSTVEGSFTVQFSEVTNLNGLNNLTTVNQLRILSNAALITLEGLDNLDYSTIGFLELSLNSELAVCHIQAICDYLENGGIAFIADNATGCDTRIEVEEACGLLSFVNNRLQEETVRIFPNPTTGTVQFDLANNSAWTVRVHDSKGREFLPPQPLLNTQLNLSALPGGLYFLELKKGEQRIVKKVMVK
jgi:hypothetical protein